MLHDLVLSMIRRKLREPTTYIGLVMMIATALHISFTTTQVTDFENLMALVIGAVFIYITEHKAPTKEEITNVIDLAAQTGKDTLVKFLPLLILIPALGACANLQHNAIYDSVQLNIGEAWCGKGYAAADDNNTRSLCVASAASALVEVAADRVTHHEPDDAGYVSGLAVTITGQVTSLKAGSSSHFPSAAKADVEREMVMASARTLKREISVFQALYAGVGTAVGAMTGGATGAVAAAASSGAGYILPNLIGEPAQLAVEYANKFAALQSDSVKLFADIKSGKLTSDQAWDVIMQRIASNKARVDALVKAQ